MNRLREFRVRADKSQIQLSKDTGVAQATISNIENGRRTPSYLTRQRLANILGFPVEEIFPNEGNLVKKGRGKAAVSKANTVGDILISNSQQNLTSAPIKREPSDSDPYLVKENRILGFVFSVDGRRLKYSPIRLFREDEFLGVTCTDVIGKFSFENLKPGDYRLTTEDKKIIIKIKI